MLSYLSERRSKTSPPPPLTPPGNHKEEALTALRSLLKRPDAEWKTQAQRDAVMAALEGKHDVVAILPTNAGKSMIAILPPSWIRIWSWFSFSLSTSSSWISRESSERQACRSSP